MIISYITGSYVRDQIVRSIRSSQTHLVLGFADLVLVTRIVGNSSEVADQRGLCGVQTVYVYTAVISVCLCLCDGGSVPLCGLFTSVHIYTHCSCACSSQ